MNSLYICYQSAFEPLTRTQVVAYLEGLARDGHGIVLLTFEPRPPNAGEAGAWREALRAVGIEWYWLRYHKRPTAPATAWDVLAGVATGLRLIRRHRIDLVHARVHVPGLMGLILKRLTGVKLLFDVRGLMAEEYVDAGQWPADGQLFRAVKRLERSILAAADGVIILTETAKALLSAWYPGELAGKPFVTIPCCVDLRRFAPPSRRPARASDAPRLVYVGKAGGCYLTGEMLDFLGVARQMISALRVDVWTQGDHDSLRAMVEARGLGGCVRIGRLSPEQVPAALAESHAALSFMRPCVSNAARSPTKLAEYLSAGLPVISTAGIGDVDRLRGGADGSPGRPLGVLVEDLSEGAYRRAVGDLVELLDDPTAPGRCGRAAKASFDLENVGWVRYREMYRALGPPPVAEPAPLAAGHPSSR